MKMMLSEELRSYLAVISLGLLVPGYFLLMIVFGPAAIICAVLALYTPPGAKLIDIPYRVCAFLGLAAGVLMTIAYILIATGVVQIPS
jgi:hypothetical protein